MLFYQPVIDGNYLQLEPSVDLSDISQVFEVDDILTLSEDITALRGRDSEKKTGIHSSAPSSAFLS